MFTLKFMKFNSDETHTEQCIRCPHYEARDTASGDWAIVTYPTMKSVDGVERWVRAEHVPDQPVSFDTCFVENENGKTITKYTTASLMPAKA